MNEYEMNGMNMKWMEWIWMNGMNGMNFFLREITPSQLIWAIASFIYLLFLGNINITSYHMIEERKKRRVIEIMIMIVWWVNLN